VRQWGIEGTVRAALLSVIALFAIGVGTVPAHADTSAVIGGVVFHDSNGNGKLDTGEPAMAFVSVDVASAADGTIVAFLYTDSNGSFSYTGSSGSAYTVTVNAPYGYLPTTPNPASVTGGSADAQSVQMGLWHSGVVTGTVYEDLNGDGTQESGDAGQAAALVELLDSGNNLVDSQTTAPDGSYTLTAPSPGTYTVSLDTPSNFAPVATQTFTMNPETSGTANFPIQHYGVVSGTVFNDANTDGVLDTGDVGLFSVVVKLVNATTKIVVASTTTDTTGAY
jgi:uncharacterized protein (DUF2141 family)